MLTKLNNKDRLIVALDVPTVAEAKKLVELLNDEVTFYKIGLELLMSGEYFQLISWLKNKNKKVFCDLKLYDISQTVGKAIKNLSQYDVDFVTIHAASRDIMLRATENKGSMKVLAVTVLTNLDNNDLLEMGFDGNLTVEKLVTKKAELAVKSGIDGVVASAIEAQNLRQNLGDNFDIVTPGIRLKNVADDDQKRICDVKTAIQHGSSYLVVGRPITAEKSPLTAAREFQNLINLSSLAT